MIIKELKESLGKERFTKLLIIIGFILVTIILYFIKFELKINLELAMGILGFFGVIITIKETEKSRIKQNKFDYQKEKINEEQIEFKKLLKEKIAFLNSINFCIDFFCITKENYIEGVKKINDYRAKMMMIKDEIFWYYDDKPGLTNPELTKWMIMLGEYIVFYNEKMGELCNVLLEYSESKDYKKIQERHAEIMNVLDEYSREKNPILYKQAKRVVEERDKLVSKKIIN